MVQWLRLHAPTAGAQGSIPGWGTKSHKLQLKIQCAETKTKHSQIKKKKGGERKHSCIVLDLSGSVLSFTIKYEVNHRFLVGSLYQIEGVPSYS